MASSHPQSRAQLLREMNKSRKSSTSSHHSQSPPASLSDFDPSQDAFMSTQQLDPPTTKLPELRASAQKYRRPSPPEPDYIIDTSAYERAFPDFTQGSMSSNSSISIELGRGTKKATRGTINKLSQSKDYSSNADIDFDKESLDIQALSNDGDAVTVTPPFNSRSQKARNMPSQSDGKNSNQPRKASNLRNQVKPSPPSKTLDYGSGDSRKSSDGTRRTLAAMHARVRDENDVSLTSTERPATVDTTTIRNTRFGNGKQPDKEPINALPSRFLSTSLFEPPLESDSDQILQRTDQQHEQQSHHQDHQQNHQRGHQRDPQNQQQTHQQTHQQNRRRLSIENVPNMSEILSGVFEDGTPVFSRNTRARSARNASDQGGRKVSQRSAVSEVDVPDDEQAIYLSLQLLQDKVSVLERSNAEAEYSVKELQQRNSELEAERLGGRRASHRSDSAIGMTDSDGGEDVAGASGRRSAIQRSRLEDSLRVLQAQADAASRKAATAESILRNITHERDSAVSQLSVAYVTVEQLKIDHEATKDENDRLRAQIQQLTETRGIDRPAMPSALVPPTTDAEPEGRPKATPAEKGQPASLNKSNAAQQQLQVPKTRKPEKEEYPYDPLFDLSRKPDEGLLKPSRSISQSESHENRQDGRHAEHQQPLQNEVREPAWSQTEGKKPEEGETRDSAEDMTYLSFVNGAEIARLRKTLEQERRDQHLHIHRGPSALNASKATKDEVETAQIDADTRASRRTSLRDTAVNSALSFKQDLPALAQESTGEQKRQHQEHSVLSTRGRRTNPENMTSAFIVPDITIRDPSAAVAEKESAQPANNDRHHTKTIKQTTRIPKPIPVSQQMPEISSEDDEPTMRPSQPPALALAIVIKGLESEIAHLKTRLAKYQQVYNSHNPALSRRKRKAVYEKIDTLLHAIDTKSDQLYSLYDVLEGQKQSGHEMTQDYVDETLQSIGLDVTGLSLKDNDQDQTTTTRTKDRLPWELGNEAAAHEDLPWEGIDV